MYLRLANGRTELIESENFRAFKVVVDGGIVDFGVAKQILAPIGELVDTSTAWIPERVLRDWPTLKNKSDWQNGLTSMIEKARPCGWVNPDTGSIRAHVEWTKPTDDADGVALLQDGLKKAMRRLAATVCIITTNESGILHGMTATAVTSLAMDPPSILISINQRASIHDPLLRSGMFCVNLLGIGHEEMSGDFSGKKAGQERFEKERWSKSKAEPPYLIDAQATISCRVDGKLAYGTHTVFIGRVTGTLVADDIKTLLHQNASYGRFTPGVG